jgi:hypothetical protein
MMLFLPPRKIKCLSLHPLIYSLNLLFTYSSPILPISLSLSRLQRVNKVLKIQGQRERERERDYIFNSLGCRCIPQWDKDIWKDMKLPVWWSGLKNSPTVTHACHKRRLKWVPSAWGYSWATLSPGVINTEFWSSRLGVGRWTNNPAP